jgi:hypothetical protein
MSARLAYRPREAPIGAGLCRWSASQHVSTSATDRAGVSFGAPAQSAVGKMCRLVEAPAYGAAYRGDEEGRAGPPHCRPRSTCSGTRAGA